MKIKEVIDEVQGYLVEVGFPYEYDAEGGFIKHVFKIECGLEQALVVWEFKETGYVVYTIAPLAVGQDRLGELLRYVAMANYGLDNGNFEVDCNDGEIRYKCYVNTESFEGISRQLIDASLDVGLFMMRRYGDGIAAIVKGESNADAEIAKAESERQ